MPVLASIFRLHAHLCNMVDTPAFLLLKLLYVYNIIVINSMLMAILFMEMAYRITDSMDGGAPN